MDGGGLEGEEILLLDQELTVEEEEDDDSLYYLESSRDQREFSKDMGADEFSEEQSEGQYDNFSEVFNSFLHSQRPPGSSLNLGGGGSGNTLSYSTIDCPSDLFHDIESE